MNKLIIVSLIVAFILILSIIYFHFSDKKEVKVEAKQMYSAPIGPTQEEPYQLPSSILPGIEVRNG